MKLEQQLSIEDITSIFAERVHDLRVTKNLTQKELGMAIGGTRSTIQNIEYSKHLPSGEVIDSLSKYFDVTPSFLLGYTDNPTVHKRRPLTLYEATETYGKLLATDEALKYFSNCGNGKQLRKLIEMGYYRETVLVSGKHVLKTQTKGDNDNTLYFIHERIKQGIHVGDTFKSFSGLGKMYNIDSKKIKRWYNEGRFEGAPIIQKGPQLFIDHHWFQENIESFESSGLIIPDHYKTLAQVGRKYKFSAQAIRKWYLSGVFGEDAPFIDRHPIYVDENWFEENFPRIRASQKEKSIIKRVESMGYTFGPDFLFKQHKNSEEILLWIDKYATHKVNGGSVNVGGKITKIKKPAKPERTYERIHKSLIRICFKIVCGRCNIKDYWKVDSGRGYFLSEEEQKCFDPSVFKVTDFNIADIDYIRKGLKDTFFYDAIEMYLKPFIWFVFAEEKAVFRQKKRKLLEAGTISDLDREEINRLNDLLDLQEDDLQHAFSSTPQHRPEVRDEDKKMSVHLTREQILMALQRIYGMNFEQSTGRGSRGIRNPLKQATCFFLGCQTGIRNDEARNLLITDFELNKEGLLQRFEYDPSREWVTDHLGLVGPSKPTESHLGYGLLKIRREIAKGGWGPSPTWGTYLSPGLVTMINSHLTSLYKTAPNLVGKGYFFRTDTFNPDSMHKSRELTWWLSHYKKSIVGFLPEKALHHFSYYDVRHTIADLILNHTHVEERLVPYLERVGELHIRHDMQNSGSGKSLIKKHYAGSAGAHEYFQILMEANDYPLNLKGERTNAPYKNFYDWEVQKGYRSPEAHTVAPSMESHAEASTSFNQALSREQQTLLEKLERELSEKESYLDIISGEYKRQFVKKFDLTEDMWLDEVPKVEKAVLALRNQIEQICKEAVV